MEEKRFINFPLNNDHGAVVYCLQNTTNGKVYIGKTSNFAARIHGHQSSLKRKSHSNKQMQMDYNNGDNFLVICLFRYPAISEEYIREHFKDIQRVLEKLEEEYIYEFQAISRGYNKIIKPSSYPPPKRIETKFPTLRPCEYYQAHTEWRERCQLEP